MEKINKILRKAKLKDVKKEKTEMDTYHDSGGRKTNVDSEFCVQPMKK